MTDRQRVAALFRMLTEHAEPYVLAASNYGCCQSCAVHELSKENDEGERIVYYHMQDDETAWQGDYLSPRGLALRYFINSTYVSKEALITLAEQIVDAAQQCGLVVHWNGSPDTIIRLTGLPDR